MPAEAGDAEDYGHLYGFGDPSAKRTRLQEITEQRYKDVEKAKEAVSEEALRAQAEAFVAEHGAPLDLYTVLDEACASPWGLALAAEFKRASPSKGDINPDLDSAEQGAAYAAAGASVLSVLTEPKWFKGSLDDLRAARLRTAGEAEAGKRKRPAVLRKDFVVDEYQILEALAFGADTVLLMLSILSRSKVRSLISFCRERGIEPLVEVVSSHEMRVALEAGARVLGVNNRNLHTFELDKDRTRRLAAELSLGQPGGVRLLALSGLATPEDVQEARDVGCSGVLIGEALMRAADPRAAIAALMQAPAPSAVAEATANGGSASSAASALPVPPGAVVVKVCGVTRVEDAERAMAAGANLLGLIFVSASKRAASVDQAKAIVAAARRFGERTGLVCLAQAVLAQTAASNGTDKDAGLAAAAARLSGRGAALRRSSMRTPLTVGVFMDHTPGDVARIVVETGVDCVQLHGKEPESFVAELREELARVGLGGAAPGEEGFIWITKVLHLAPKMEGQGCDKDKLRQSLATYGGVCDALLLDTAVKGAAMGGTGQTFDWETAKEVQELWGVPVTVAGGLTGDNVGELVQQVRPFGVDVASGVEADVPGVKCERKTTAYVRNAKRAHIDAFGAAAAA